MDVSKDPVLSSSVSRYLRRLALQATILWNEGTSLPPHKA